MAYPTTLLMSGFVTHDTRRFVLERPRDFSFEPGQGIELTIDRGRWRGHAHPFTPTCLVDDRVLELTIKRYPGEDSFTSALHGLEPRSPLTVSAPFGTITYRGVGVFIAAGAGVTPFLAILRALAAEGALSNHRLLFSNKTRDDLICGQELQHYLGGNAVFTYTREAGGPLGSRRIDLAFLRDHVDRLDQYFYMCGPDPFVASMKEALTTLGVDPGRLVYEQ